MKDAQPRAILLSDYRPPDFLVEPRRAALRARRRGARACARGIALRAQSGLRGRRRAPLVLDGQGLALRALALDGARARRRSTATTARSCASRRARRFVLDSEVEHATRRTTPRSRASTARAGCSAPSARPRDSAASPTILDRPDVLSRFTTTIVADARALPGAAVQRQPDRRAAMLGDGRHWVRWHDPFPKPCYLFALVAGRPVGARGPLHHHVGPRGAAAHLRRGHRTPTSAATRCESLKQAMKWDEEVYGREYDLDVFMIVAVDDFNMGAMENKGLNIFNSKYVLARPDTATDDDFQRIEGVVAHEYFHNWSGNRVTCRDWFQLSLKEGFTVFRDQEFSGGHAARARCERIERRAAAAHRPVRRGRRARWRTRCGPTPTSRSTTSTR